MIYALPIPQPAPPQSAVPRHPSHTSLGSDPAHRPTIPDPSIGSSDLRGTVYVEAPIPRATRPLLGRPSRCVLGMLLGATLYALAEKGFGTPDDWNRRGWHPRGPADGWTLATGRTPFKWLQLPQAPRFGGGASGGSPGDGSGWDYGAGPTSGGGGGYGAGPGPAGRPSGQGQTGQAWQGGAYSAGGSTFTRSAAGGMQGSEEDQDRRRTEQSPVSLC